MAMIGNECFFQELKCPEILVWQYYIIWLYLLLAEPNPLIIAYKDEVLHYFSNTS